MNEQSDNKWLKEFLAKLENNICPSCDAVIEKKIEVKPCIYAEPCGHRLYQGTLNLETTNE